jgi:DNA uptake protein ComE-like DNA-binding protein
MTTKIRVNLANQQELQEIPGIGPEQAATIVKSRSEHGPIMGREDLARLIGHAVPQDTLARVDFSPADSTAPEAPGA